MRYAVGQSGSPRHGIDAAALQTAAARAFALWKAAKCGGGKHPGFFPVDDGVVTCERRGEDPGGSVHVIAFHDGAWQYDPALTALTVHRADAAGSVLDMDVELNSTTNEFVLGDPTSTSVPLVGVLAHEVGHFLGLAHSPAPGSLMAEDYVPLPNPALSADDVAGICAVFPPAPDGAKEEAAFGELPGHCRTFGAVATVPAEQGRKPVRSDPPTRAHRNTLRGLLAASVALTALIAVGRSLRRRT